MNFFDPNFSEHSAMFELGSAGHVALNVIMFSLLGVMIAFRRHLPRLRQSRRFMAGTAGLVLALEALSYALKLVYPCHPAFERLPLHLCASMKIALTLAILLERYDVVRYLAVLSVGCGFISFVNLNLAGEAFGSFAFWHYVIGHAYLFLAPLFLLLAGDLRVDARSHLWLCVGLAGWSLTIFLVNWAFDTNYMYTGPHNTVVVPLVPRPMMEWPFNYVSYVLIALVLLNATYAILRLAQPRRFALSPAL